MAIETNQEEMNSGMYVDAMNQLKEKFEDVDNKVKSYKSTIIELQKELISQYGIVRILDDLTDETMIEPFIKELISIIRTRLSDIIDREIFN